MTGAVLAGAVAGVASAGLSGNFATVNSVTGVIPGAGPVTTTAAIVTNINGTAPLTYAWSMQLGGDEWTINSPTASSTTFTYDSLSNGDLVQAVGKVIVTDAAARTVTLYPGITVRSTSTL